MRYFCIFFGFLFSGLQLLAAPADNSERISAWLRLTAHSVESLPPEELRDLFYDLTPFPLAPDINTKKMEIPWKSAFFKAIDFQSGTFTELLINDLNMKQALPELSSEVLEKLYLQWAVLYRLAQNGVTQTDLNSNREMVQIIRQILMASKQRLSNEQASDLLHRLLHLIVSDLQQVFPSSNSSERRNLNHVHRKLFEDLNRTFAGLGTKPFLLSIFELKPRFLRRHSPSLKNLSYNQAFERVPDTKGSLHQVVNQEYLKKAIRANKYLDRYGIEEYFHSKITSEDKNDSIQKMIDTSAELRNFADIGRTFRLSYLQYLRQIFGEQDVAFFIDPVVEVLRRVRQSSFANDQKELKEISFNEAEKLAWNDTIVRFSLHDIPDPSQLETFAKHDAHFAEALDFYQQSIVRYSLAESPQDSPQHTIEVSQFKQDILNVLVKMRIKNFHLQILETRFQENRLSLPNSKFLIQTEQQKTWLNLDDLQQSEISFHDNKAESGTKVFLSPTRQRLRKLILSSPLVPWTKKPVDSHLIEAALITQKPLANPHYSVVIQPPHQPQIILDETEFRKLFFSERQFFDDLGRDFPMVVRFQIEGLNRDTELAHLIELISSQSDINFSALQWRLFKYIEQRDRATNVNRNLTEWMRLPEVINSTHRLNDLRWGGWAIHPMFWRVKDIYSKFVGQASLYGERMNSMPAGWRGLLRRALYESHMENTLKSVKKRIHHSAQDMGLVVSSVVVLLGALHVGWANVDVYDDLDSKLISFDTENRSEIHSYSDLKKRKNRVLFSVKPGSTYKEMPKYFNYLSPFNMPSNWQTLQNQAPVLSDEETTTATKPYPILKATLGLAAPSDITINTEVASQLTDFGIPILTPSGHRLQRLQVQINGGWKEIAISYLVTSLGVYYAPAPAEINSKEGVIYRASFTKDARIKKAEIENLRFEPHGLKEISESFKSIGATELAKKIKSLSERRNGASFDNLTSTFATSGYYTYSSPNILVELLPRSGRFSDYQKFLVDGSHHYQCTGANNQYVDALNLYFQTYKAQWIAHPIGGFVYKPGSFQITGDSGHLHTIVASTIKPLHFKEADATPLRLAPGSPKEDILHPFSEEERNKVKSPVEITEDEKSPTQGSHISAKDWIDFRRRQKLVIDQPNRDLDEITDTHTKRSQSEIYTILREKLHLALAPLLEQASFYQLSPEAYSWRGLGFMRFLQSFNDYYEGRLSVPQLLREVISIQLFNRTHSLKKEEEAVLERRFQEILRNSGHKPTFALQAEILHWKKAIETERSQQLQGKARLMYLTDIHFVRRIQKLLNFMESSFMAPETTRKCQRIFL